MAPSPSIRWARMGEMMGAVLLPRWRDLRRPMVPGAAAIGFGREWLKSSNRAGAEHRPHRSEPGSGRTLVADSTGPQAPELAILLERIRWWPRQVRLRVPFSSLGRESDGFNG